MKIRTDFITNSSSSSFVAFVVSKDSVFSEETYENLFRKILENEKDFYATHPQFKEEGKERIAKLEAMEDWEREAYVNEEADLEGLLSENSPLEIGGIENDWIGMTISTVLANYSDLKISEIKNMVAGTINKEFGTDFIEKDIDFVEEAWRDG